MKPYTDRNIKSTTQVSLPFGTMIFTHGYWQRRNQTTYQYSFDEWFDADQMQPTNWRHLGNRKDVRDLMISEGKATPGEGRRIYQNINSKTMGISQRQSLNDNIVKQQWPGRTITNQHHHT